MARFKEGQEVILVPSYNLRHYAARRAVVTKVGRKYAYVAPQEGSLYGYEKVAFDLETGWQKTQYSGEAECIIEPEVYALEEAAGEARKELREEYGISLEHRGNWTSVRIIALLDAVKGLMGS